MKFEIADKSTEIQANWNEAKLYCFSIGEGWRLPTKEELNEIYQSENDFEKFWYWSSTENDINYSWNHHFGYGVQNGGNNTFSNSFVRAVRDLKDN